MSWIQKKLRAWLGVEQRPTRRAYKSAGSKYVGVGPTDFGLRLRVFREARGITQGQMARMIGVRQSTLSLMEHGKPSRNKEALERLCTLTGMTVEQLYAPGDARDGVTSLEAPQ